MRKSRIFIALGLILAILTPGCADGEVEQDGQVKQKENVFIEG